MEKLKINYNDCAKVAETVFTGMASVWVNLSPETPCIEIIKLSNDEEYDFADRNIDISKMTDWMQDMYKMEWQIMDILDGWKDCFNVEKAQSYESFNWMEEFVNEVVAPIDEREAIKMSRAIGGKGTFYRFKVAAAQTGYLDRWYQYLNGKQTEYIATQFRGAGIDVVDSGGMPVITYPALP